MGVITSDLHHTMHSGVSDTNRISTDSNSGWDGPVKRAKSHELQTMQTNQSLLQCFWRLRASQSRRVT